MADEIVERLVYQVLVEGDEVAVEQLQKMADKGVVALEDIEKASARISDEARAAGKVIDATLNPALKGLGDEAGLAAAAMASSSKKIATSTTVFGRLALAARNAGNSIKASFLGIGTTVNGVSTNVNGLNGRFGELFAGLGNAARGAGTALASGFGIAVTGTVAGVGNLGRALVGVSGSLLKFSDRVGQSTLRMAAKLAGVQSLSRGMPILAAATILAGAAVFSLGNASGKAALELSSAAAEAGQGIKQFEGMRNAFLVGGVSAAVAGELVKGLGEKVKKATQEAAAAGTRFFQFGDQITKVTSGFAKPLTEAQRLFAGLPVTMNAATGALSLGRAGFAALSQRLDQTGEGLVKIGRELVPVSRESRILAGLTEKLGAEFAASLTPRILQSEGALIKFYDRLQSLGSITSAETIKKLASDFSIAMAEFRTAYNGLKIDLGAAFTPVAVEVLTALSNAIADNKATLIGYAQTIATFVKPILLDLINIFSGRAPITEFGKTIVQVGTAIKFVFDTIMTAAGAVAGALKSVFGIEVTAGAVALIAILGPMALAFSGLIPVIGAVVTVIGVVVTAIGAVVAAFGLPVIAIVALTAALAALTIAFNPIQLVENFVTASLAKMGEWATSLGAIITKAFADFGAFVSGGLSSLSSSASAGWEQIKQIFFGALDGIGKFFKEKFDYFIGLFDGLVSAAKRAGTAAKNALTGGGGGGGNIPGRARGGHIVGDGTGTSDSILSWLSNGEFVIKAAMVRKYGSSLFHALNQGMIPRYAQGGQVMQMGSLKEVSGGFGSRGVAGGAPRTSFELVIEGQRFSGLSAPADTADSLQRVGVMRRLTSTGKAPSWQGRR